MKKINFQLHEPAVNKLIGNKVELLLDDNANIIDAIREVDKIIESKGKFPSKDYGCLLHWVYNPREERFYEQTALNAYTNNIKFLNIRNEPKMKLPDNTTILLIPDGPCISAGNKPLSYEEFKKSLLEA